MTTCNTFSNTFDSTPIIGSTDSIVWNYAPIDCLNICTGERLTSVEYKIAQQICTLMTQVDASVIVMPSCLVDLWNARLQDQTVLNLLDFILTQLCEQLSLINANTAAISNINPFVTIDLSCCSTNPCVQTGTIRLSDALQSLATCICDAKSQISTLQGQLASTLAIANSANTTATNALSTLTTINNSLNTINTYLMGDVKNTINQIITDAGNSNVTLADVTTSVNNIGGITPL